MCVELAIRGQWFLMWVGEGLHRYDEIAIRVRVCMSTAMLAESKIGRLMTL
jgi:hypothetical protein